MSKIAILSGGPSLATTWHGGEYHTTIGVNVVPLRYTVDHLVCGDGAAVVAMLGDARPRIDAWTMSGEVEVMQNAWPNVQIHAFTRLPGIVRLSQPWSWSIQGALAVAWHLGAMEIDLYGHDMTEGADIAGKTGYRTGERWARERSDIRCSIELLRAIGIRIRRIAPFQHE